VTYQILVRERQEVLGAGVRQVVQYYQTSDVHFERPLRVHLEDLEMLDRLALLVIQATLEVQLLH
jgi:hypothetical protein